jgi:hypothetical protein
MQFNFLESTKKKLKITDDLLKVVLDHFELTAEGYLFSYIDSYSLNWMVKRDLKAYNEEIRTEFYPTRRFPQKPNLEPFIKFVQDHYQYLTDESEVDKSYAFKIPPHPESDE